MSQHFPESVTFGALSSGETLYAEKISGGSEPTYKLYRLMGSTSYENSQGSLSSVTVSAKWLMKRDQDEQKRKVERQEELDQRAARISQLVSPQKIQKKVKAKGQEFRSFKRGILILLVVGAVLFVRALVIH